jgi:hypothetical protein
MELKEIYGIPLNNFYAKETHASKEKAFNYDSNFQNDESFTGKFFINNYQLKDTQRQDYNLRVMK